MNRVEFVPKLPSLLLAFLGFLSIHQDRGGFVHHFLSFFLLLLPPLHIVPGIVFKHVPIFFQHPSPKLRPGGTV